RAFKTGVAERRLAVVVATVVFSAIVTTPRGFVARVVRVLRARICAAVVVWRAGRHGIATRFGASVFGDRQSESGCTVFTTRGKSNGRGVSVDNSPLAVTAFHRPEIAIRIHYRARKRVAD